MKGGKSKADTAKKADNKLGTKKNASGSNRIAKKPAAKKGKDPNKPKRPPSAFFVFMAEFREQFKVKNPQNKSVAAVGKAAGDKWKSMSDAEKAPYASKAAKKKAEYEKTIAAYNKKQAGGGGGSDDNEEESDKSKSEINDDDEDGSEEEEDDD